MRTFSSFLFVFCATFALGAFGVTDVYALPPIDTDINGGDVDTNGGDTAVIIEEERDPEEIAEEEAAKQDALDSIDDFNANQVHGESTQERANFANSNDCEGLEGRVTQIVQNESKKFGRLICSLNKVACTYDCHYSRVWSCFPPETKIAMADGSQKRIDQIVKGDMVWNPARQKAMRVGNRLKGPEDKPLLEIGFGTTSVRVTQSHPMVIRNPELQSNPFKPASMSSSTREQQGETLNARVKKANEISLDDWILGADGEFHQVTTLRTLAQVEGQIVYNFELETDSKHVADHMIVADGVVTGDVVVQADLNDYALPWQE